MSKDIDKEMVTEKKGTSSDPASKEKDTRDTKKTASSSSKKKSADKQVDKLKSEVGELKDKYLRLYSEFENYRRRTAKERLELVGTANEELMAELLPVIDDFERAIKAQEDNGESETVEEGFRLIYNKLKNITEKKGLKVMKTEVGDEFDSEIHDAISQIPAPEEKLKGRIVDTVEKGYYLNDKVIRFAKVVIGA